MPNVNIIPIYKYLYYFAMFVCVAAMYLLCPMVIYILDTYIFIHPRDYTYFNYVTRSIIIIR